MQIDIFERGVEYILWICLCLIFEHWCVEQAERMAGSQDATSPDATGQGRVLEEDEIACLMSDFMLGMSSIQMSSLYMFYIHSLLCRVMHQLYLLYLLLLRKLLMIMSHDGRCCPCHMIKVPKVAADFLIFFLFFLSLFFYITII